MWLNKFISSDISISKNGLAWKILKMLYLHFFIGNLGFIFCKEPIYILCHFFLTRWVKFVEILFFVGATGILIFCQLHALQESFQSVLSSNFVYNSLCFMFIILMWLTLLILNSWVCTFVSWLRNLLVILMYIYKDK